MKDKMDVVVPIRLEGTSPDIAQYGAIVEHIMREIEVRALVSAIPHEIVVDITPMTINKGIVAGDIKLPEGVELKTDKEAPVVHLAIPKDEETPAPAATTDAAAAQPESSSTKGKKDEEGNLTKGTDAAKK
jgi:large subunit ribosomal protein L25